jgi:hypothetical protein
MVNLGIFRLSKQVPSGILAKFIYFFTKDSFSRNGPVVPGGYASADD